MVMGLHDQEYGCVMRGTKGNFQQGVVDSFRPWFSYQSGKYTILDYFGLGNLHLTKLK